MLHKFGWTKEILDETLNRLGFIIVISDKNAYQPNTHLHYVVRKK